MGIALIKTARSCLRLIGQIALFASRLQGISARVGTPATPARGGITGRHGPCRTNADAPSTTRPPLSPAERIAVAILAAAMVGTMSASPTRRQEHGGYVVSVAMVARSCSRRAARAAAGAVGDRASGRRGAHLAGGLVAVGDDVLYNASIGHGSVVAHAHPAVRPLRAHVRRVLGDARAVGVARAFHDDRVDRRNLMVAVHDRRPRHRSRSTR